MEKKLFMLTLYFLFFSKTDGKMKYSLPPARFPFLTFPSIPNTPGVQFLQIIIDKRGEKKWCHTTPLHPLRCSLLAGVAML